MKKRIFAIILFVVAIIFTLSGCSCEGVTILSFSNAYNGGSEPLAGYTERCEYTVEYSAKNEYYEKSSKLSDSLIISYENGTYVTELKVESGLPATASDGTAIESDIRDLLDGKTVLHFTTELTIDIRYSANGKEDTHTESIRSEIYFGNSDMSFAPIYSKTVSETSLLLFKSASINTFTSNYTTVYNQNDYTLTGSSSLSDGQNTNSTDYERTQDYTFRSLIDNAEFMFAVRNKTIAQESTGSLLATALTYDDAQSIIISHDGTSDSNVNFTYNGEGITELTLNSFSYTLNESTNTGMPQYYFLQAKETDTLPNKSLLVKYIEPIIEYSSIECAGSFIYNLKSVTVTR